MTSVPSTPRDLDLDQRAAAAEEVRAYLVAIRGGAPFLSGADGRLLVDWLDQGVPVPHILGCIDRVAERRRTRRAKSRLTLSRCKSEVRKTWGSGASAPKPQTEPEAPEAFDTLLHRALDHWIDSLAASPVAPPLADAWSELLGELRALGTTEHLQLEPLATSAIGLCRRFHERAWDECVDQDALRQAARSELESIAGALDQRTLAALVEESAHSKLRQQLPQVSAERVWDTLHKAISAGGPA